MRNASKRTPDSMKTDGETEQSEPKLKAKVKQNTFTCD